MKRIFTLLALSFLFAQAQAQVLFYQDFESGSIDPMTAIDADGKTVHPNVASVAGPTWQVVGTSPNRVIVSTSWFNPVGQADDWIISPALEITQPNTILTWQALAQDPAFRDGYEVRISTTDNQIASFTNLALNVPAEETTWKSRSLNLDAYIGQTIYFAFRNHSNDKFLLYMDNIRVEVFKSNNAIVRGISFEKYNPVNTQVPIKVTVENHGALPLNSLEFTWTDGTNYYTDTLTNLNIATLATQELTHSVTAASSQIGEFGVGVLVANPNAVEDEDPADNTGGRKIYFLDQQLPKKVVVEEGTGTWCGWCPRGAVNIDAVYEANPDLVMPIAIHNGDPMTNADYDSPFSQTISGYPSGHVDRKEINLDPADFGTAVAGIQDRMVPVQVKTQTAYDPETRMVTVYGTAHSSVPTQANDLRFTCVITEDHVTGTDAGYNQTNYYAGGAQGAMGGFEGLPDPVPASQMEYRFVARAILGGFSGLENSIPDAVAADEDFNVQFTYQVPQGYDVEQMKAIIFIQDEETGEILNGDIVDVTDEATGVTLIPEGKFSLYPNPTVDNMTLTVDYTTDAPVSMKVFTTNGALVKDLGPLSLANGKGNEQINVSGLESGMYILELRQKNAVTALPFVKL